jgi:hypothetical protein
MFVKNEESVSRIVNFEAVQGRNVTYRGAGVGGTSPTHESNYIVVVFVVDLIAVPDFTHGESGNRDMKKLFRKSAWLLYR